MRQNYLYKTTSTFKTHQVFFGASIYICLLVMILNPTRYVCEAVSRRASMMASAGVTALLKKMDYKDVVIAIDGSLFRFHPHFKNVMQSRISQMMGINYKFDLLLSEDGSGRGAALVAAVLKRD